MSPDARGALIEIVERRRKPIEDSAAASTVIPDEVRINGQPLMVSADRPITIHEIDIKDRECVLVTLTLFARRVLIGAEEEETRA